MRKKGGAVGAMPPTHYLSNPGGGRRVGGVAYKDRARPPHPPCKGEQNQKWLPHRPYCYFFLGSRLHIEISVGRKTKKAYLVFFYKKA